MTEGDMYISTKGERSMKPILLLILFATLATFAATPPIIDGTLDLRSKSFDHNSLYVLKGDANFYWSSFVDFKDIQNTQPTTTLTIPGIWNNTIINNAPITGIGYGTIAVKILLPPNTPARAYSLKIGTILSSYRLFIDSTLIKQVGKPSPDPRRTHSDYDPTVCITPMIKDSCMLIMQIANFDDMKGGPWQSIFIGTPPATREAVMLNQIYDIFFISLFLIFAWINLNNYLLLHSFDKRFSQVLYLAIFSLLVALRTGLTGERVFYHLLPVIPLDLMLLAEYLAFFFGVSFYHRYIHSLFHQWSSTLYTHILTYVAATFSLIAILTPLSFHSQLIPIYQVIMLVTICYQVVISIKAFKGAALESIILSLSSLTFLVTATFDLLRDHTIGVSLPLIPLGASIVIAVQAMLILRNNRTIFGQNKVITEALTTTNATLERFVPQQFFKALQKDALTIKLGDHTKLKMTVLFCDIRRFSSIAEHMSSNQTFIYINRYLALITPIITAHNGFIDKFIGDAVVALFPQSPLDAAAASREIQEVLHSSKLHQEFAVNYPLQIGIGLHYASMTIGIIGNSNRMDSTVMGDAVNTASRIEQLTKQFGVDIIVTQSVLTTLLSDGDQEFNYRHLGDVMVRGKNERIELFELFSSESNTTTLQQKLHAKEPFEEGLHWFAQNDISKALPYFTKALELFPNDKAATYYIDQCSA